MPGGHSLSIYRYFTRTFWAKEELHCIFRRKKAIIITSKHGVEASNVINDPKCNKGPKCNNFWP